MRWVTITIISAFFLLGTAQAAGPIKLIKVVVSCSCDDSVGSQLCSALKEKIRGSNGFELVSMKEAQESEKGFAVSLTSVAIDDNKPNNSSAVAVVFLMPLINKPAYYMTSYAAVIGSHKIEASASDIMGDLDKETAFLQ